MAELKEIVLGLSDIEKKCLASLKDETQLWVAELAERANLNVDSVRRAVQWLHEKGLAEIKEFKREGFALTKNGAEALENGLPEKRLADHCQQAASQGQPVTLDGLKKALGDGFGIALGTAKKLNWVSLGKAVQFNPEVYAESRRNLESKHALLKTIADQREWLPGPDEQPTIEELRQRGLIEKKEHLTRCVAINENGKQALALPEFKAPLGQRKFVIDAPVPRLHIGKRQPYVQFINQAKRWLVSQGFKEVPSPLITQEFYNFDVLFQPQNHPARTWSDTYQLKRPTRGRLPDKKIVDAVRAAHENGGKSGSKGWGHHWSEDIARKVMPASHCTAHDARQWVKGIQSPGKYFSLNRVYRPDVLDAKHLVEFNQLDGFIVGEGINFRHQLGIFRDFAREIAGATEVRFTPDYFPFTEPSVQLSCKHPELGWMEFAGGGCSRPEIPAALGIKEPMILWGLGVDRLAMIKMGVNDIRHLFSDDLPWLRNARPVKEG